MKRFPILLLLLGVVMTSACTKEYNTTEVIPNFTVVHTVAVADWTYTQADGTYNAIINMPEIDNVSFENDGVIVAAMFDRTNYEALPQVYDGYSYTFFYQPGYVSLSVQGANGGQGARPTGPVTFKIVLVPSAQ
ncbi:hypothetical protein [uncultured Chitinophaga sp.]|uniref:hypothetical protein n=1 Tax=uncultured Chitinophaga sp. TaxID=339340 RepID=UPI00261E743F|nr:hypothetical protein [uncultured Chitinophaga sp.]